MKKVICLLMAFLMAWSTVAVLAEEANYDTLVVGNITPAGGSFFLENLFGNNTTDMDIRDLLHGYPLTQWGAGSGTYLPNDDAVSGLVVMDNPEGNRVYEIALRSDMYYSDGTPITAWDYAFSILLSISPEMEKIGAAVDRSDRMVGAGEYQSGAKAHFAGVEVLNDYLLTITIRGEFLPYFYELALISYRPYPIHVIAPGCEVAQADDGIYIRNIDDTGAPIFTAELLWDTVLNPDYGYMSHPYVVSGPYKVVSFDPNTQTVELTVNENYKGNSEGVRPRIPTIVFSPVSNEEAIEKLKNGEIQLFNKGMRADAVEEGIEAAMQQSLSMSSYPRVGLSFISFACEKPVVSDAAVRQAIAYCFDRDTFIREYVGENNGLKVNGYYGVGQWMYQAAVSKTAAYPVAEPAENASAQEKKEYEDNVAAWDGLNMGSVQPYDFDTEMAKAVLDEAGWTIGSDGIRTAKVNGKTVKLELTLGVPMETSVKAAFDQYLVPNLEAVGIRLTVEELVGKDLLQQYNGIVDRTCDAYYLASNFMTDFDPSRTFMPGSFVNYTGIQDQELYDWTVEMRNTRAGDVVDYCRKWVKFQERFMEVLPMVPVYSNVYFDFYSPELQEYQISNSMTLGASLAEAYYGPVETEEVVEGEEEDMEIVP